MTASSPTSQGFDHLASSTESFIRYEDRPDLMNFATLAKFHQKAFGSGSPLSFAGSHSAASSPMTLNFGDLEMDDSASTASASPEFTRRELESDSESDRSSSGLRTPEGSPPSSRTLSQAGQVNCKAKQPQAVLVHGQWSPDSTSDEGSSIGDEDQESPFSLSLPTESPLQAVRPPGLPLPAHFSTPIKAHSAPGFKKSSPKGIPLSHTTSSMPKSRVKQAAVAGPRSAPSAREAEESRRGRSRWPRLLWRSEIDTDSLDVLQQYHTRAVGQPLPKLEATSTSAAVGHWSRKMERAGL